MRALMILAVLSLAAACGSKPGTDEASGRSGANGGPAAAAAAGTDTFMAEVVDVDAKGHTITLRSRSASASGAGSAIRRVPVAGAAQGQLSSVKSGDEVVVGCDEANGGAPTSARASSGPDGADSGVGPSGTESLATCRSVVSVAPLGESGGDRSQ